MKTILFVDEDKWTLSDIIIYVEAAAERKVIVAGSCSEAIKYFHEISPDYIVLDSLLPIGDLDITATIIKEDEKAMYGLQLLSYFRSKNNAVRIIGYSMLNKKETENLYKEHDAEYISKMEPNSFERLLDILTK